MTAAYEQIFASLAKSLLAVIINASEPSSERAVDILTALQKESSGKPVTLSILANTKIGKIMTKTVKACKRHKRTASSDGKDDWDEAIKIAETLLFNFKLVANIEQDQINATLQKNAERDAISKKQKNGNIAGRSRVADAEAKQSSTSKEKTKKMNVRNTDSSRFTKNGKTKQSPALLKMKSKRANVKTTNRSEPTQNGKAKQSSALKQKTEEEDTAPKIMMKSKRVNAKKASRSESTKNGKAKQPSALKQKTEEKDAAPKITMKSKNADCGESTKHCKTNISSASKQKIAEPGATTITMDTNNVDSGESTEQYDKAGQPCNDTPVSSSSSRSKESTLPLLYKVYQRVYAKDDATGLIYPAFIRKTMWGPKSNLVNLGFCSSLVDGKPIGGEVDRERQAAEEECEDEDARRWDPRRNCHHYYVHYMGWNVKWDRWVEESFLYEDSASTDALAKTLTKEYNKVKPKRRGQKMSVFQLRNWMKQMTELEEEHKRLEKEGKSGGQEDNGEGNSVSKEENIEMSGNGHSAGEEAESNETMKEHFTDNTVTVEGAERTSNKKKDESTRKLDKRILQKQAELRGSGLQMKRKRSISDRLTLPFNLKKILVDEWEVITQCDMVHKLPSQVSVRDALNRYVENKLAPLKEKQEKESSNGDKKAAANGGSVKMQIDIAQNDARRKKQPVLGKEWVDMVEGIALFFDSALPVHLLFAEERSQYNFLRRQILAQRRNSAANAALMSLDDCSDASHGKKSAEKNIQLVDSSSVRQPCNTQSTTTVGKTTTTNASETSLSSVKLKSPPTNVLPERMSEIYGCEHLLRLFVRLPAIVAATPAITELESRRIFSKLGDLVRYLQKHQSQLFCYSFRRPLVGENRGGGKKVSGK